MAEYPPNYPRIRDNSCTDSLLGKTFISLIPCDLRNQVHPKWGYPPTPPQGGVASFAGFSVFGGVVPALRALRLRGLTDDCSTSDFHCAPAGGNSLQSGREKVWGVDEGGFARGSGGADVETAIEAVIGVELGRIKA